MGLFQLKFFYTVIDTGRQSAIRSATSATSTIAEVALRFDFLFSNIAEVAVRTKVFENCCALIALHLNFFSVKSAILYIELSFAPFRS